jgi:hypothetical protein
VGTNTIVRVKKVAKGAIEQEKIKKWEEKFVSLTIPFDWPID